MTHFGHIYFMGYNMHDGVVPGGLKSGLDIIVR